MSFFNTTLVGGVQDISAILPLLGTEQVERHIGSALTGGFLYAAACPMSLFGSLGAVRIAFTVLVATCTDFRRSPKNRWIGARWLADAGFSATGDVACLIGSPASYLFARNVLTKTAESNVYLAEEKLTRLIDNLHIDNVEKLRIQIKPGLLYWNLALVVSSLIFAAIGITPYIYFFRHSIAPPGAPPLWVYPMMRTLGTMMVVVSSQFIIQLRLLQILRSYVIFLALTKLHQEKIHKILNITSSKAKEMGAEELIRQLSQRLSDSSPSAPKDDTYTSLRDDLNAQEKKHRVLPSTTNILIFLGIIIIIGGFATIIGYIGSFTVVQSAETGPGPLIWLATEGGLSLTRILIWGSNPGSDDNDGLEFILETSPNKPLLTCINSVGEIEDEKLLPLKRGDTFLREIASYIGPVESFTRTGVSVYYTLTGDIPSPATHNQQPNNNTPRILYVTVYDYKEQASSFIVKIVGLENRDSWKYFKVQSAQWDTLHVSMGVEIDPEDNVFTKDIEFLDQLQNHCRELSVRWNSFKHAPVSLTKERVWSHARKRVVEEVHKFLLGSPKQRVRPAVSLLPTHNRPPSSSYTQYEFGSNWGLVLQSAVTVDNVVGLGELTVPDEEYLKHGDLERSKRAFFRHSGWWNASHMALMRDELSQERPIKRSGDIGFFAGDKLEVNEIEHLLFTEGLALEGALAHHFTKTEEFLSQQRERMVQGVLGQRESFMIGTQSESDLLKAELAFEDKKNFQNRRSTSTEASLSRLSQQRTSAIERLESLEYREIFNTSVTVSDRWRTESRERETTIWNLNSIVDLENEFPSFQSRLSDAKTDFSKSPIHKQETHDWNKSVFATAERRCTARWEAWVCRRQMEKDHAADLEEIKTQVFHQIEGQAEDIALERITSLVRIMRSKYTRFLDISDDLIKQTQTLDMLLGLIQYNEVITVVTLSSCEPEVLEMEDRIIEVIARMPNVIHYEGPQTLFTGLPSLSSQRVSERLAKGLPVITYNYVSVQDVYRRSNPYLVFGYPGGSFCSVQFQVASHIPATKVLLLSHCGTRVPSRELTRIQITVKKSSNDNNDDNDEQSVFKHIYSKHLEHDYFVSQLVQIDNLEQGFYKLEIRLVADSEAVYWMDHVELADFEYSYHWRLEHKVLEPDD